jgi:hypothetical protein
MDNFWTNPPENETIVEKVPGRVYTGAALIRLLNASGFSHGNSVSVNKLIDLLGLFWMKRGKLNLHIVFSPK